MFRSSILNNKTNKILNRLFAIPYIKKNFALAGGTALALQIKHRHSIDLDLFAPKKMVIPTLQDTLKNNFKELYVPLKTGRMMFFALVDGVKTDFVMEPAPVLEKFIEKNGVKMFSVPDIAAMKLHTICGRGKKKDFFDLYALLRTYSWEDLLDFFIKKYSEYELPFLYRSIQYFDDADKDADVAATDSYKEEWSEIKKIIRKNIK